MDIIQEAAGNSAPTIDFARFQAADIRVGRIVEAAPLEDARKPAYRLVIDFGPVLGTRKSSAQITEHYACQDLPGKLVAAVVNFPPRQIGKFMSEVLTLGFPDEEGRVVLFSPDGDVPLGARMF